MKTILLISPYWKEDHRWMVSSVKLADLWQRLGYRVVVACMGESTSTEEVSPTLMIYRRKDWFLPDPWNYGISLGFSGFVRRLAKELQPNLIVVNKVLFWTSLAAIRLRLAGHCVLVLTDALVGMTWWPRGRIPKICAAIYAWTLGWLVLACAQRVVFFHPQPQRLLQRLGIEEKSQVIPTGIDPAPYGRKVQSAPLRQGYEGQAKGEVQSLDQEVAVTYVGRLESVKGVEDYLAAVVPLKKDHPSLKIQVVGWYRDDHPLVRQYEREVIFTGLRKDIPEVLGATDIFVLPSYSEGLSNALMEAMASGCACVASEAGGNSFLLQNGISGFLFAAGDREALRSHVRRLVEDPVKRASMGTAARARIDQIFSWDKVGAMYQRLFEDSLVHTA